MLSGNQVTRLSVYGGIGGQYGSFAGKVEVEPPIIVDQPYYGAGGGRHRSFTYAPFTEEKKKLKEEAKKVLQEVIEKSEEIARQEQIDIQSARKIALQRLELSKLVTRTKITSDRLNKVLKDGSTEQIQRALQRQQIENQAIEAILIALSTEV